MYERDEIVISVPLSVDPPEIMKLLESTKARQASEVTLGRRG